MVANITARQETIAAIIGDSVTIQFYISALIYQSFSIKLSFVPECQCSMVTPPHSIVCDGAEESITMVGIKIMTVCFAGRLNVTVTNVTEEALGEYTASITVDAIVSDTAISNLKLVSQQYAFQLFISNSMINKRVMLLHLKTSF